MSVRPRESAEDRDDADVMELTPLGAGQEIEDIRAAVEALFEEKGITRLFRNRITKK